MRSLDGRLVFSPSDLSGFLSSPFASWMDRFAREYPDEAPAADAEDALLGVLAKRGLEHETSFEQRFREAGLEVVNIDDMASVDFDGPSMSSDQDVAHRSALTIEAIKAGVDVVAQATLVGDRFAGVADFLVKVPGRSELGEYHYEVWDTKLARSIRPGVFSPKSNGDLRFHRVNAPTSKELNALVATISERVARYLERQGWLVGGA